MGRADESDKMVVCTRTTVETATCIKSIGAGRAESTAPSVMLAVSVMGRQDCNGEKCPGVDGNCASASQQQLMATKTSTPNLRHGKRHQIIDIGAWESTLRLKLQSSKPVVTMFHTSPL